MQIIIMQRERFEEFLNATCIRYILSSFLNNGGERFQAQLHCQLEGENYDSQCARFMEAFSLETRTNWIVSKRIGNPIKYLFRKTFMCQLSTKNKSHHSNYRNRNCEAKIDFMFKKSNRNTWKNDRNLKSGLNCVVDVKFCHSHPVSTVEYFSLLRCPRVTAEKFHSYFASGMTPAAAKNYHEAKLVENIKDERNKHYTLANAQINPTIRQVYALFEYWRKGNKKDRSECESILMECLMKGKEDIKETINNKIDVESVNSAKTAKETVYDVEVNEETLYIAKSDEKNLNNANSDEEALNNAKSDDEIVYNVEIDQKPIANLEETAATYEDPQAENFPYVENVRREFFESVVREKIKVISHPIEKSKKGVAMPTRRKPSPSPSTYNTVTLLNCIHSEFNRIYKFTDSNFMGPMENYVKTLQKIKTPAQFNTFLNESTQIDVSPIEVSEDLRSHSENDIMDFASYGDSMRTNDGVLLCDIKMEPTSPSSTDDTYQVMPEAVYMEEIESARPWQYAVVKEERPDNVAEYDGTRPWLPAALKDETDMPYVAIVKEEPVDNSYTTNVNFSELEQIGNYNLGFESRDVSAKKGMHKLNERIR